MNNKITQKGNKTSRKKREFHKKCQEPLQKNKWGRIPLDVFLSFGAKL